MDASFYYLVRNASQYYLYILKNPNDQVVDDITEYVDYLQWTIDIKEWPLLRNEAMREKDIMVQEQWESIQQNRSRCRGKHGERFVE